MKLNYQKELEKTLKGLDPDGPKPKLLLHSCCGPCSSYILDYLNEFFDISILFYNPNIFPDKEYYFRKKEQEDLIKKMGLDIKMLEVSYRKEDFYQMAEGREDLKEGGKRCVDCYRLRLEEAGKVAKEQAFDYFTTSLSISPHKNSQVLNKIGQELENKYGVKYLYSDFKKNDGYKKSVELSKIYGLYRQDYCGCEFSYKESLTRHKK